jgi:hypothetical protein
MHSALSVVPDAVAVAAILVIIPNATQETKFEFGSLGYDA